VVCGERPTPDIPEERSITKEENEMYIGGGLLALIIIIIILVLIFR
jgi:hypothetical protein